MSESNINRTVKAVSGVFICTMLFKLLGFVREIVLSYFFGTSYISDAYLISQTIPGVIFEFVGVGVTTCFIPIYLKIKKDKSNEKADKFTNSITTLVLAFALLAILVVTIFAPYVVHIFASGFTGETLDLASLFTRICVLSLIFSSFVYVYSSYLQANEIFMPASFSAVVCSAVIILSIIIGAKTNILVMSIGSCLAVGFRLFFIIPSSRKNGLKTKLVFSFKDRYVSEFFKLMIPVILGTSINEINTLVDRTIASNTAVGGISALTYANSMIQLIIGGIVQSITTVIYPKITSAIHEGEYKKAVSVFNTIANLLMYILIPMTFGIALFGRPIISILFERGEFDESALSMTSEAFIFYGLGLCFIGIRELLTRVFYSCEDTKTPMVNSSIGLVLNVILNILLSQWIGLNGLAIATSISAFVTAILLWVKMKKNQNLKNANISFVELVKIVGASVGMGAGAYCLYRYVFAESAIGAIIGIFSGVVLYIVLSFVLRIRVVKDAIGLIRRKK